MQKFRFYLRFSVVGVPTFYPFRGSYSRVRISLVVPSDNKSEPSISSKEMRKTGEIFDNLLILLSALLIMVSMTDFVFLKEIVKEV